MIAKIPAQLKNEDGAIAVATLAFVISAGLVTLVLLWGISYLTGAYNALYAANQSAAYAAATAVKIPEDGETGLTFKCAKRSGAYGTNCNGPAAAQPTDTLGAADAVMRASLSPGVPGRFGLTYDGQNGGNVFLVNEDYQILPMPVVKLYEFDKSPSEAENYAQENGGCNPPDGQDYQPGEVITGAPSIICWQLYEYSSFPPQYKAAVVTRALADLPFLPGCSNASLCPTMEVRVVAAAIQDRPPAPCTYQEYGAFGASNPGASQDLDCQTATPGTDPPRLLTRPKITGTAQVGLRLSADPGRWQNASDSFAYQWLRCGASRASCVDIDGAYRKAYLLGEEDEGFNIRLRVWAYNRTDYQTADAAPVGPVLPEPDE